jgi:tRNA modification GTPase
MRGNAEMPHDRQTIFALATAPGRAGVAVVRVSGPRAIETIELLTHGEPSRERNADLRALFDPMTGERIDSALVLYFKAPHSYTGENVVEFQTHGGRAVQSALFAALGSVAGCRPAQPGEFTRRAVENGRLDLTQAEAIADLVSAETDAQRRLALRQYDGHLAALYEGWRARLIRAAAWLEAGIDFADEEIPPEAADQSRRELAAVLNEVEAHLSDGRRGEILREGFQVAVIGPPNAGKSSLVNALARRDIAIVSEQPGTTRDVIEARLDIAGYPVILADTAGLRESGDAIEREGVRRALARAEVADLRLLVLDGSVGAEENSYPGLRESDLLLWNKADIAAHENTPGLWVSARTGEGMDELIKQIGARAAERLSAAEGPVLTRARHRHALDEARSSLLAAAERPEPELAAEHLRRALRALGRITGRVDLDELLDVVFRDFCIGK